VQDFRKLQVWQKSYQMALDVYRITRSFPKEEMYGLTSQMRRAAVSVPANIAEGCGRFTDAELLRFLDISMGSASELDTYLMLCRDLEYLDPGIQTPLAEKAAEVKRMLTALILKIRPQN
jgi:four helix bundle protein